MSSDPANPPPSTPAAAHPSAKVQAAPRFSLVWVVPLLALAVTLALGYQAWGQKGLEITLHFAEGHGLKAGATLRHRGIVVGRVDAVRLASSLDGVTVKAVLDPEAEGLARVGSRFWIVRPELGLDAIGGLDTLVGDRYLGVLPGSGPAQTRFEGLPREPVTDALAPGLDLLLEGESRGSLNSGSPVLYRGIRVGSVISVGLASDARTVEVGVRLREGFTELARPGTRFWDSGGVDVDIGLSGLSLRLDSLQQLARGGVSLAVPEIDGEPVGTGHRYALHREPEETWLRWQPSLAMGHSLLPPGAPLPRPLRAALVWTEGRIFKGDERREGLALLLPGGLLVPDSLVTPPEGAHEGTPRLEVAGQSLDLTEELTAPAPGLSVVPVGELSGLRAWARERQRRPDQPEDCLAVGDPTSPPLSIAAGRFSTDEQDGWLVDGALPIDERWHGAAVIGRRDGRLVGVLLVGEDGNRVAPLPGPLP